MVHPDMKGILTLKLETKIMCSDYKTILSVVSQKYNPKNYMG